MSSSEANDIAARTLICCYCGGRIAPGSMFIMTDLGIAHYFKTQCIGKAKEEVQ